MDGNMLKYPLGGNMPRPRGLTMVEVVIACAILSVAIVGTFNVWINSQRVASLSREESIAQTAINQAIAELRSENFFQIPTYFTNGTYPGTTERYIPWVVQVNVCGDTLPRGLVVTPYRPYMGESIQIGSRWYAPAAQGSIGEMRIIVVNDENPVEQELGEVNGNMDGYDLNQDGQISNLPFDQVQPLIDYTVFTDTGAERLFPRRLKIGPDNGVYVHQYLNISDLSILPVVVQVRWWSDAGLPREVSVITFLTNRAGDTSVPFIH